MFTSRRLRLHCARLAVVMLPFAAAPAALAGAWYDPTGTTIPAVVPMSGCVINGPCAGPNSASNPSYVAGNVGGFNAGPLAPNGGSPAVTPSAYSAGFSVGGLQTVTAFRSTAQPSGILGYVGFASKSGAAYVSVIRYGFTKSPASTCADHAAFALSNADLPYLIPGFPVSLSPAALAGTMQTYASQAVNAPVNNQDSTPTVNLYFCDVTTGTPTPGSTSDVVDTYSMARD